MIEAVITMGGMGSRFRNAGYSVPKYMIEAKGKTLFEWSLISLTGFSSEISRYTFIAKRDDQEDVEQFIRDMCEKLHVTRYEIIIIDYLTDGQATTAMLASKHWDKTCGLLIYNIDTYVESGAMNAKELKGDGFIPCFIAPGDHWSFVKLDKTGKATEVREKERISDFCTLGAYYFKTCDLYEKLYKEYYSDANSLKNLRIKEKYVAPLYNHLISKGGSVFISVIENEKVHVLGTPEELNQFLGE